MELSIIGLLVCVGVLLASYCSGGALVTALIASLAFGSTAVMTLSSLGGSSPLIYTFFAALLLASVAVRKRLWEELGHVFGSVRPVWLLSCLMFYGAVGAWLFPRLFAGQTSVFAQSTMRRGVVVETPLEPVSANISQTGYFILGGLTAIALCMLLLHRNRLDHVRRGFFLWCGLHTGMGLIDFLGKLAGAGDVLEPIRTASYAMLTEVSEAGFSRIAGAFSEASAFGGVSLACLGFTYTYWRKTGSRLAKWLSMTLLVLIVLSTSSTAYAGLAILSIPVAFSLARSLIAGRLASDEVLILAVMVVGISAVLAISLYDQRIFDPFTDLIDNTVINKSSSQSGQERAYWNLKSIEAFADTSGLGVGFGSSRASSWPIAVLSQLGLLGTILTAALFAVVARGMGGLARWVDPETNAVVASVRASSLAGLAAASVSSGSADPGMIFFIALAVISTTRAQARRNRAADPSLPAGLVLA